MPILTIVTFHGLDASDALHDEAVRRAQRLERFAADISLCEVTFRADSHRLHRPNRLSVQVNVILRGNRIGVKHGDASTAKDEDAYLLLLRAFEALTRRVEDYVRCRRGDIKAHVSSSPVP